MSERTNETAPPTWRPFGKQQPAPPEPADLKRLARELRDAAEDAAAALAAGSPADALTATGNALAAATAIHAALTQGDRPLPPAERVRRSLFRGEDTR